MGETRALDDASRTGMARLDLEDDWLLTVMKKERNRVMLAALEKTLSSFIQDPKLQRLPFPPKGAFHRKVCHAVAQRYQLDHRLEQAPNSSGGELRLVLIKTSASSVPSVSLDQLLKEYQRADGSVDAIPQAGTTGGATPRRTAPDVHTTLPDTALLKNLSLTDSFADKPKLQANAAGDTGVTPPYPTNIFASERTGPSYGKDHGKPDAASRPSAVLRRPGTAPRHGLKPGSSEDSPLSLSAGGVKNITVEEYKRFVLTHIQLDFASLFVHHRKTFTLTLLCL